MPLPTGDRPFDVLATELATDQCDGSPTLGSALGLTEYDDRLPDMSAGALTARERLDDAWAQRLRDLAPDALSPDEAIDRDFVLMVLRGRAVMRDWADWRRSPDHYSGPVLHGVFGLLQHRLRPPAELAAAVAARLSAAPDLLQQGIDNLRAFRAARIVVDTSLHLGEMTVEAATEHMSTAGSLSRAPPPRSDHGSVITGGQPRRMTRG